MEIFRSKVSSYSWKFRKFIHIHREIPKCKQLILGIIATTLSQLFWNCKSKIISKLKGENFLVPVVGNKTKQNTPFTFADTLILGIFLMLKGTPSFGRIPKFDYIHKLFILNIDTDNLRPVNLSGSNCSYKRFQILVLNFIFFSLPLTNFFVSVE